MNEFRVSLDDVIHHVASIGLDIFPPLDMRDERTRLHMFFEDVREQWPNLYEKLTTGESEFRLSKPFRKDLHVQGPAMPVDTFVLTPRGPVFVYPLRLPEPVGVTDLESQYRDLFTKSCKALWSRLPGHKVVRVGLIRDVMFHTRDIDCAFLMSGRPDWLQAKLVGGKRLIQYRDERCNIRLEFSPGRIGKVTELPVGAKVKEPVGFGVKVRFDVNNAEVRELRDTDIEEVLDRADGFWPDELLKYLSEER